MPLNGVGATAGLGYSLAVLLGVLSAIAAPELPGGFAPGRAAAVLAAFYSQARDGAGVSVDYTPARNVKKPVGSRPGMVVYTTYQTIVVDPDESLVKSLGESVR